ncbi:MAG: ORF6N domain-containing protein [Planctomycetota bacterium]
MRLPPRSAALVPVASAEKRILLIRGQRVLLDSDLAVLYGVETRVLVQAVKRNIERFPEDFLFRLTPDEALRSRSQIVILNDEDKGSAGASRLRFGALKRGANIKYLPYAFTEQGVAMLSSVLRSPRAVRVNIEIMRAFVRHRQMLQGHTDLARKLAALERKYDVQFRAVFDAIRSLMEPPVASPKPRIGFRT